MKSTKDIIEFLKIPKIDRGCRAVWRRNFQQFSKTWVNSAFWIVLEPLIYLGAIGFGLGSYVNNMQGASYVEFFFPGLLGVSAMFIAYFEGTYNNYSKLTHEKIYSTMLLARLSPDDIAMGEILWGVTKAAFGLLGILLVAAVLGLVTTWKIIPALVVLLLLAWIFSAAAMIAMTNAKNFDSFIYSISGFIMPMVLLSGTYFPIEHMPIVLKILVYLFPLTHGVVLVRGLLIGDLSWIQFLHFVVLVIMAWISTSYALKLFKKRVIK